MTNNEIMKSIRCCADGYCKNCSFVGKPFCKSTLLSFAWDAIYNQQAEIERLNAMVEAIEDHFAPLPFKNAFDEYITKIKSEAQKEFAEIICRRLYDSIENCDNMTAEDPLWVNRLKWAYESTAIFIRDFIIKCEFEASLEEMEKENGKP